MAKKTKSKQKSLVLAFLVLFVVLGMIAVAKSFSIPKATSSVLSGRACESVIKKNNYYNVPLTAVFKALWEPETVSGFNKLCDESKPESPFNGRKRWLSVMNPNVPYHPLNNPLVYKCSCP